MGLISNGTTIFDNGAVSSSFTTSMVLVSSATASSSSSIIFTLSSYNIYKFFYVNVHPSAESKFQFNSSYFHLYEIFNYHHILLCVEFWSGTCGKLVD